MFTAVSPTNPTSVKIGYFLYTSVGSLLSPSDDLIINSQVIGAFVNDPKISVNLPENSPANFNFKHLHKYNVANPRCVFWDQQEM